MDIADTAIAILAFGISVVSLGWQVRTYRKDQAEDVKDRYPQVDLDCSYGYQHEFADVLGINVRAVKVVIYNKGRVPFTLGKLPNVFFRVWIPHTSPNEVGYDGMYYVSPIQNVVYIKQPKAFPFSLPVGQSLVIVNPLSELDDLITHHIAPNEDGARSTRVQVEIRQHGSKTPLVCPELSDYRVDPPES